jgi:hypothetical protein
MLVEYNFLHLAKISSINFPLPIVASTSIPIPLAASNNSASLLQISKPVKCLIE